jgi:nitrite reductase (NO-forming)
LALILTAVALVGFCVFALSGGLDRRVTQEVHAGGPRTVRVSLVDAVLGFDVTPDRLVVDAGTRVVLDVVNRADGVHDLAVRGGARTRRLAPGESQHLDLGVVSTKMPELYCTLPGHSLAGMTLEVVVRPTPARLVAGAFDRSRRGSL